MEYLQDKLLPFLQEKFSFDTLHHFTPLFSSQLSYVRNEYVNPYILEPLSALLTSSTPDLVTVLLLLLLLYISLRILDYARRVIMFWVFLILRLAFWGLVIGGGIYVYNVGPDKVFRDFGWFWEALQGVIENLSSSAMSDTTQQAQYDRRYTYETGYQTKGKGR